MTAATRSISLRFLNRAQVESLLPGADELVSVIEAGLRARAQRDRTSTKGAPRSRSSGQWAFQYPIRLCRVGPARGRKGHRGLCRQLEAPSAVRGRTADPVRSGDRRAVLHHGRHEPDLATHRRGDLRRGPAHLAKTDSRIVTHLGARGTAFQNLKLLANEFDLAEIRVASRRSESRERLAARVREEIGVSCIAVEDIEGACRDADIIVEATRLERPTSLISADAVKPGALIVTYGWMMAVDPELPFRMDKLVVDDWAQCRHGGALYPLIESGRLTDGHIHAEIGEIVCGAKPGRERGDERILFWHRGFAISDIMLGHAIEMRAEKQSVGTMLPLLEAMEE
jgi:ornithine cyclodeaminase